MNSHQERVVSIARKQFAELSKPDGGIELRHRDAGRHNKHVELMVTFEEGGHFYMVRSLVHWWATSDHVSHIVMRLMVQLQNSYINTRVQLSQFGFIASNDPHFWNKGTRSA